MCQQIVRNVAQDQERQVQLAMILIRVSQSFGVIEIGIVLEELGDVDSKNITDFQIGVIQEIPRHGRVGMKLVRGSELIEALELMQL